MYSSFREAGGGPGRAAVFPPRNIRSLSKKLRTTYCRVLILPLFVLYGNSFIYNKTVYNNLFSTTIIHSKFIYNVTAKPSA